LDLPNLRARDQGYKVKVTGDQYEMAVLAYMAITGRKPGPIGIATAQNQPVPEVVLHRALQDLMVAENNYRLFMWLHRDAKVVNEIAGEVIGDADAIAGELWGPVVRKVVEEVDAPRFPQYLNEARSALEDAANARNLPAAKRALEKHWKALRKTKVHEVFGWRLKVNEDTFEKWWRQATAE
jgi:hypothetical protein